MDKWTNMIKTILAFHKAVDSYTVKHQRNVARISGLIAKELGLDREHIRKIKLCALVHDVGKIAIPIFLLNKTSPLMKEEFELIKTHTKNNALIKAKIFTYAPFYEVITQHHERLNGSGYPLGLKSDDICFEAKLIAVADVYEAMSTDRPYRRALGEKATIEHIISGVGTLYDQNVVKAFEKVYQEWRQGQVFA